MLAVNEIYGPVKQGEGKTAGLDVMFLRLSGCNLACVWCDTPMTWNWKGTKFEHPDKYDQKLEVHKMECIDVLDDIRVKCNGVTGLVISGGEPMLQQVQLIPLLRVLHEDKWWVEIETNGTIAPLDEFKDLVNQFNCSPKLSNAGKDNPYEKRLNFDVLKDLVHTEKATFKFVIQCEKDMREANAIISDAHIDRKTVWLMPEGKTKEEQLERQTEVEQLTKPFGYNFSPRLHILEFGNKRAV